MAGEIGTFQSTGFSRLVPGIQVFGAAGGSRPVAAFRACDLRAGKKTFRSKFWNEGIGYRDAEH
jgi:hypothetical protein